MRGGLPDAWKPGRRYGVFTVTTAARFREMRLFLTAKPRGNGVLWPTVKTALGPRRDARSPDLSFVLIDDCTPARDAEWKGWNREFRAGPSAGSGNQALCALSLVPEVAHPGKDHGDAQPVGRLGDGVVTHR